MLCLGMIVSLDCISPSFIYLPFHPFVLHYPRRETLSNVSCNTASMIKRQLCANKQEESRMSEHVFADIYMYAEIVEHHLVFYNKHTCRVGVFVI